MSEKRYPTRMHEVLGVGTEERFTYGDYGDREFWLSESGLMYRVNDGGTSTPTTQGTLVFFINNLERITHRPRYTPEQVEQLKALKVLGFEKGWMAKDKDGEVCAHKLIPYKNIDYWISAGSVCPLPDCGLVSWSDPEPLSIAQALRDAGVEA